MKRYQVSWDMVRRWIKEQGNQLRPYHRDRLSEFTTAILEIDHYLAYTPLSFGEPHFNYKHLGLTICIAFRGPLVVHYGVNKKSKTVYVSGLDWR